MSLILVPMYAYATGPSVAVKAIRSRPKQALKPEIRIQRVLLGNLTIRALQSSEVEVDRQEPMVLHRYAAVHCTR